VTLVIGGSPIDETFSLDLGSGGGVEVRALFNKVSAEIDKQLLVGAASSRAA
jgi:hypothetical protein